MPTHQSVRSQPHRPENQHLLGKLTQLPTRPTLLPHRPDSTALLFTDPNPPTCFTLIRSPIDLFFSRFWPSCCFPLLPWKRIILWIGVHHQSHPLCQRPLPAQLTNPSIHQLAPPDVELARSIQAFAAFVTWCKESRMGAWRGGWNEVHPAYEGGRHPSHNKDYTSPGSPGGPKKSM
jgi:hypothetical protein